MKFALTLVFALSIGMAFADGKGCACCGKSAYNAKPMNKKDAEFLAMADAMAAGGKKMDCSMKGKAGKGCPECAKAAKAAKAAKRARAK